MINKPIFFERNRVGRVYTGGKLFAGFFGDEAVDGFEPEEWIASGVRAINKVPKSEHEGLSKVQGKEVYFDELLKKYPEELLGRGNELRILVKALDSAIRLPAQAHPDKEFSKKHFRSKYGKTESWLILDTREDAKIYFGFKNGVTKEDFEKAIDDSEFDKDAMERLMIGFTPKKGDIYLVPAKTVHAIGKGCLILEIQEPTDFTIQPERYCGNYKLSDKEMYMGLTREASVSCFNFGDTPEAKCTPVTLEEKSGIKVESLIGPKNTDCFIINRITLNGGELVANVENSYAIYIVTEGEAEISDGSYSKAVKKGDYFFMPASLMGKFKLYGNAEIIECY